MRTRTRRANIIGLAATLAVALLPSISPAQDASKSDPLAAELVKLLEGSGLQYIAAKAQEPGFGPHDSVDEIATQQGVRYTYGPEFAGTSHYQTFSVSRNFVTQ